jgi:hypothetical protein
MASHERFSAHRSRHPYRGAGPPCPATPPVRDLFGGSGAPPVRCKTIAPTPSPRHIFEYVTAPPQPRHRNLEKIFQIIAPGLVLKIPPPSCHAHPRHAPSLSWGRTSVSCQFCHPPLQMLTQGSRTARLSALTRAIAHDHPVELKKMKKTLTAWIAATLIAR